MGHATKCGADQNSDNLRINRAYLQISDYCSVTIRVRVIFSVRVAVVVYKLL